MSAPAGVGIGPVQRAVLAPLGGTSPSSTDHTHSEPPLSGTIAQRQQLLQRASYETAAEDITATLGPRALSTYTTLFGTTAKRPEDAVLSVYHPSSPVGGQQVVDGAQAIGGGMSPGSRAALAARVDETRIQFDQARGLLARTYPEAMAFGPANAPGWNPETFDPRSPAEAQLVAYRVTIDIALGTSELEHLTAALDLARYDATMSGSGGDSNRVRELERQIAQLRDELMRNVDVANESSNGALAQGVGAPGAPTIGPGASASISRSSAMSEHIAGLFGIGRFSDLSEAERTGLAHTMLELESSVERGDVRVVESVARSVYNGMLLQLADMLTAERERDYERQDKHDAAIEVIHARADLEREQRRVDRSIGEISRAEAAVLEAESTTGGDSERARVDLERAQLGRALAQWVSLS